MTKKSAVVYVDDKAVCAITKASIKATRETLRIKGVVYFDNGGLNALGKAYSSMRPRFSIRSNTGHRRQKVLLQFVCITVDERIELQFIKQ